jgi:taurine dioxygenase
MIEVEVRPISPVIGAHVDVDDVRKLSAQGRTALKDAVHEHLVVFLRDQDLSEADLAEVASWFGEPIDQGHGGLVGEMTYVSTYAITPDHPPRADLWHADQTYLESPPAYACLYNLVAPAAGGDTVWASSYAAFEALSPPLRRLCSELTAQHSCGPNLYRYVRERSGEERLRELQALIPPREQPLVIRHPHTGRPALVLTDNFLDFIVGLQPQEDAALRALLRRPYDDPNHHARIRWRPGSLAIFDERATNHRGLSDHWPTHPYRTTRSVFISDGIPLADLAWRERG